MDLPSDDPEPSLALLSQFVELPFSYWLVNSIAFAVLILASALISGSEVAFFSLSREQLKDFEKGDSPSGNAIMKLLNRRRHLLATILIMNNLINIAIVTLSTFFTWSLVGTKTTEGKVIITLSIIVTFIILFFGEVVPKNFANQHNVKFAKATAKGLLLLERLLRPFSFFLIAVTNVIEKNVEKKGHEITVDGLNQALEMTTDENTSEEEKGILKGIVNFSTLTVKQVMKSRMDITAVENTLDFHELMDKINKCGFSRIPVYNETIDKIDGILYIKDLISHIEQNEDFAWQELVRPGLYVPENKKADSLLKDFQAQRVHMAIVVDEYGGTSGLITMEDIIEEIVGEINDEFDDEDVAYNKLDNSTYIFEGKTSLNDFCKIVGAEQTFFDEVKGESESLGGLLLEINEKLPRAGEKISFENFLFTIVAVDPRRIKRIRVLIKPTN
ncbi:gliding motility-associated protein GldE [Roseivirga sp.]|uniref:gliding motility-associated protein GldE n=1 Tax=Roseivirga sp. TaxID=1964215 RepID=UPI003B8C3DAA